MALTLEAEQRLESVGLIKLYKNSDTAWLGAEGIAVDDRLIDNPLAQVAHENAGRFHVALACFLPT